jgi:hypothetical protein
MAKAQTTVEDEVRERVAYKSPYEQWKDSEGLPTYRGLFVKNLLDVELTPWASSGEGRAAIIKEGGDQIEYEDEDRQFHADFEAALKKAGAQCRMGSYHPFCTQK